MKNSFAANFDKNSKTTKCKQNQTLHWKKRTDETRACQSLYILSKTRPHKSSAGCRLFWNSTDGDVGACALGRGGFNTPYQSYHSSVTVVYARTCFGQKLWVWLGTHILKSWLRLLIQYNTIKRIDRSQTEPKDLANQQYYHHTVLYDTFPPTPIMLLFVFKK